jgi:hypothetical protein
MGGKGGLRARATSSSRAAGCRSHPAWAAPCARCAARPTRSWFAGLRAVGVVGGEDACKVRNKSHKEQSESDGEGYARYDRNRDEPRCVNTECNEVGKSKNSKKARARYKNCDGGCVVRAGAASDKIVNGCEQQPSKASCRCKSKRTRTLRLRRCKGGANTKAEKADGETQQRPRIIIDAS